MEVVGKHANSPPADVVAEFGVALGALNGLVDLRRFREIEALAGAEAEHLDGAVGKLFLHGLPLLRANLQFDAVGRADAGSHFDAEGFELGAIGDQRRQVPIVTPLVRDQSERDLWSRLVGSQGRKTAQRPGGHGRRAERSRLLEKATSRCVGHDQ